MPIKLTNLQDQVFTLNHPDNAGPLIIESTDIQKKSTLLDDIGEVFGFEAPCKPTLDLDFGNQDFTIYDKLGGFVKRPLADLVSQGRATAGTSTDAIGGVTEFAAGENRFTFDGETGEALGYLSEESRTNLLTYSEDFSNASWSKDNCTFNLLENNSVIELIPNTSNTTHSLGKPASIPSVNCRTYYVKSNGYQYVQAITSFQNTLGYVNFDIVNGSVTKEDLGLIGKIQRQSDGYFKITITTLASTEFTGVSALLVIPADNSSRAATFSGDGVSSIFIKNPQLEVGSFPTSYIRTLGAPVTRGSDSMTRTLGQEWNPNEGTFVVDVFINSFNIENQSRLILSNSINRRLIYATNSASTPFAFAYYDTFFPATYLSGSINIGVNRVCVSLSDDQVVLASNGLVTTGSANARSVLTALNSFKIMESLSSSQIDGTIKHLQYYPRAFDAITLQRLSRIQ